MKSRRLGHKKTVSTLPLKVSNFRGGYIDDRGQMWTWGDNLDGCLGVGSTLAQLAGATTPMKVLGDFNFKKVCFGGEQSFAIDELGHGWGWGLNLSGNLGNLTKNPANSPVSVAGGFSFKAIHAGASNTVAVNGFDGSIWGWGSNGLGELGNLTLTGASSPVSIAGGMSFTDVKTNTGFSMGLQSDGSAWCWGLGTEGQLGNQNTTATSSPVSVVGGHNFTKIDCAAQLVTLTMYSTNFGLKSSDGSIWAWGSSRGGKLGNNTAASASSTSSPVSVVGGISFTNVFTNDICTYGLQANGTLWAWGINTWGNLGDNTTTTRSSPVSVLGSGDISFINVTGCGGDWTIGSNGPTLALDVNGNLWSWGSWINGQTGLGTYRAPDVYTVQASPVPVMHQVQRMRYREPNSFGGRTITLPKVTARSNVRFFLTEDGQVWSWGSFQNLLNCRYYDRVAIKDHRLYGLTQPRRTLVTPSFKATDVSSGTSFAAVVTSVGEVWAWGANSSGQLGQQNTTTTSSPVSVVGGHSFTQISCGPNFIMGLKAGDGSVWEWGVNDNGQLGQGTNTNNTSSPVSVVGGHSFIKVSAGDLFSVGLKASGDVWCWGRGTVGRLGTGNNNSVSSPVSVVGGFSFIDIATGLYHTLALLATGAIWSWGRNNMSQCGNNNQAAQNSPVSVSGSGTRSYTSIFAGDSSSLGINGTALYGWGLKSETGGGTASYFAVPTAIDTAYSWSKISSGTTSTIGLTTAGILMAWGSAVNTMNYYDFASGVNSPIAVTTFYPF